MRHSPKRGPTADGRDAYPVIPAGRTGGVLAILVLVLIGSVPSPASASPPDTLEVGLSEAARRALARSPDLEAYRSQRRRARARREEATASRYVTEFQATTGHAPVPGLTDSPRPDDELYLDPDLRNDWDQWVPFNQIEVEATQPLYTFGQLSGSIEAARHGVEVEDAEVAGKAEEVALRTARLYLNVLLTEELLRLAEETGKIVERAKREIQRLLKEGDEGVDNADLFQVRLTEQEYRRRVTEVRQRRRTARSALRSQLMVPDSTVLRLTERSLDPLAFELDSLDTYEQLALAHRSEILRARAGLAARNALLEVARSDWYPKLFLRGRARLAYTPGRERQPNPYISDPLRGQSVEAGIGFRQNLNFGQTEARVEQARAERNEVRHQQEGARRLVEIEVEDAYRNLIISRSDMRSRDTSVTISEEWLRTEQINFDLDLGDTENLVDAVRSNLEAEAAYFQAVHGYDMAVLRLLKASGVLAERLRNGRVSFED